MLLLVGSWFIQQPPAQRACAPIWLVTPRTNVDALVAPVCCPAFCVQALTSRLTARDEESAREILTSVQDMANCAPGVVQTVIEPLAQVSV